MIHSELLLAVHAQPDAIATLTLPDDVPAPTDALAGVSVAEHDAPTCVTVNVCPAIVSVPVRDEAFGLAVTL